MLFRSKIEIGLRINNENFGWRKCWTIHEFEEEGVPELIKIMEGEEIKID